MWYYLLWFTALAASVNTVLFFVLRKLTIEFFLPEAQAESPSKVKKHLFHLVWCVPPFWILAEIGYLCLDAASRGYFQAVWQASPLYLLLIMFGFVAISNVYYWCYVTPKLRSWYDRMGHSTDAWDLC